jgi:hypothetical protein
LADVRRAASIRNVGFCKLKLKRFGGLDLLKEALDSVRQFGMEPAFRASWDAGWRLVSGLSRSATLANSMDS